MTKEKLDKIAKRYAQDELKDNHGQVEDIVAAAFLNGIDYAEHHPHWISVEDELPTNKGGFSDEVLTYDYARKRYVVALFCYISNCWFGCDDSVTHWMALPQPPAKLSSVERIGKN